LAIEADLGVAIALPEPLNGDHEVGPHRLRTSISAPDTASDRGDEEQRERGNDQQTRDVVELLRPDLEWTDQKPLVGKIDQERL
jgi:hypothetical protein